jgi:hypothetical protein
MDVFFDPMYGGEWTEIERKEIDRVCNWALYVPLYSDLYSLS